jgi:hypothetical protein
MRHGRPMADSCAAIKANGRPGCASGTVLALVDPGQVKVTACKAESP